MDRKSILVIVICVAFMFLWQTVLVPKYFTAPPVPGSPTNTPALTQPAGTLSSSSSNGTATATSPIAAPTPSVVRPTFSANTVEELIVLTTRLLRRAVA
jgi:hypothetical protein